MSTWFLGAALLLALVGAGAVIAFESPTRSAGGLLTAFVGVAAAAGALGAPLVPGYVLWVGGGGIGMMLLAAVLILNLRDDERGPRRLRVRPALAVPVLGVIWAALAAPLVDAVPEVQAAAIHGPDVARAVVDDFALAFTIGLVALAVALVVAIALVRRRT
jgi:NADH:ubiquinone oxidoreductase subunit 6 (subunit J)